MLKGRVSQVPKSGPGISGVLKSLRLLFGCGDLGGWGCCWLWFPEIRVGLDPLVGDIAHFGIDREQLRTRVVDCGSKELTELLHAVFAEGVHELLFFTVARVDIG